MTGQRSLTAVAILASAAGVAVAGCGSDHRRPAAEPAVAPVPAVRGAGRSVPVGTRPEGMVADGRTRVVAVAVRDPPEIVFLDARRATVVGRVPIPGAPRHLQLAGPGGPVLVPEEPVDHLLELPLHTGGPRSIAVGAHPHDAAADAGRVFVADEHGRSVSVVQGSRVIRTLSGFTQPGGVAAVGPDVAIVDVGADTVSLIDARSLQVTGRLPAGSGPTHAAAGARDRLFVIDTRGDAVLTYATRPAFRVLGRTPVPGTPYGVASDPARHRLWVTETATNRLVELATATAVPQVIAAYPTGRQPNTVTIDPGTGRVFVADAAVGSVEIIDPRR